MHVWLGASGDDQRLVLDWVERGEGRSVDFCKKVIDIKGRNADQAAQEYIAGLVQDHSLYPALQCASELMGFLELLSLMKVKSYLEIGARYGGTFEAVMDTRPIGSNATVIDFPGGEYGDHGSVNSLLEAVGRQRNAGHDVSLILGPSSAPEVVERAGVRGPYDCVFIDADHAYEAVKRDFEIYAPMGKMIVLHDIVNYPVGVPKFWNEIKGNYKHVEIVEDGSGMGIGAIFRD
jgi:cephalosporin hydroxylase